MLANLKGTCFACSTITIMSSVNVCPETPLPEHKTSDDGKGNQTMPVEKSEGVLKAVENVDNNTRLSQSRADGKLPLLFVSMQPAEEHGTRIPLLITPNILNTFCCNNFLVLRLLHVVPLYRSSTQCSGWSKGAYYRLARMNWTFGFTVSCCRYSKTQSG